MNIVIDLFDLIMLYILGGLLAGLALFYVIMLLGYAFSRLIKKMQERFWK